MENYKFNGKVIKGNIFDSECDFLVNPVNCVGVMGKGLALQFKNRFPEMFKSYEELCVSGAVKLGQPLILPYHRIICFPTKHHWKEKSYEENIIKGIEYLNNVSILNNHSCAFPLLGAGLGGLDPKRSEEIIKTTISNKIFVEIYKM